MRRIVDVAIFQFPLLGIFHCTIPFLAAIAKQPWNLSIPVTWDFPLHLNVGCRQQTITSYSFQFPLLGIFHCTIQPRQSCLLHSHPLSIPVTWDFPLHPAESGLIRAEEFRTFNSRYLGFSIAPAPDGKFEFFRKNSTFNSRYLGFSIAP